MNTDSRFYKYLVGLIKFVGFLAALYFFICSLTFLSTSFRILGGKNLSSLFSDSDLLSNPIIGVMIGILVTVLVQSSATSTSIIVSLVSAGVGVKHAVPMILGSNVGTSVTNTIVSMTQAGDRECFRRAFAAATVHDMFNWLAVIVLMAAEVAGGFLQKITKIIVDNIPLDSEVTSPDFLQGLTRPFTEKIVQVDREVLLGWSLEDPAYDNVTTIMYANHSNYLFAYLGEKGAGFNDVALGIILLILSLCMLVVCLLGLMKILNSVLSSRMVELIQKTVNADIPYVPWLTGYLAMLIGCLITILVRSSSIFTSTLTPLCGAGLVTLETVYPMTLGSNIGTTTTSILASFAAEGRYIKPSIQIAFVHLLFNIIGIVIFYPIPWMRWPIPLAKHLGDITAEYRWFAALYLVVMFFLLPLAVFLLSLAGLIPLYVVLGITFALFGLVAIVNLLQDRRPEWLPKFLQDWSFLPLWMRSLKPLDDLFAKLSCCKKCFQAQEVDSPSDNVEAGKTDDELEAAEMEALMKELKEEKTEGNDARNIRNAENDRVENNMA